MTETDDLLENTSDVEAVQDGVKTDDVATRLMAAMVKSELPVVRPSLDLGAETGFGYPTAEEMLGVTTGELIPVLESLSGRGILRRDFFDKLARCSMCQSVQVRPSTHCPKCRSGNIVRNRVLEHVVCGHTGAEDEFVVGGRYVCSSCGEEMRNLDGDYRSLGVQRTCRDCGEIFSTPMLKWRCIKCLSVSDEQKVSDVVIYAYSLDESKRDWLEFELKSKMDLLRLLRAQGYEAAENALVTGRSGAEHTIDILATRDDGIVNHRIAIGIEIARGTVGPNRILEFDVKAYDCGLANKVLIIIPELGEEAMDFARYQGINVLRKSDLGMALAVDSTGPPRARPSEPFEFRSKAQLTQYLEQQGYEVKENAEVEGRSGATHSIDILATKDEGIITHRIAIGMVAGDGPLALENVFDFDDKAYDAGILNKVFVAVPGLTKEAEEFARRQRIRVFEVKQL